MEVLNSSQSVYTRPLADKSTRLAAGGVRGRVIRGLSATALGPAVTSVAQVVTVAILVKAWGAAAYGTWLMVSAIPGYLSLSDIGFGTVAANDMTMRVAAGDRDGALVVFQSTWALVTSLTTLAALIIAAAALLVPLRFFASSSVAPHDIRLTCVLLSFASGTVLMVVLQVLDSLTLVTVALSGGSLVFAAGAGLATRVCTTLTYAFFMLKTVPWLRFGLGHASVTSVRALARPASMFMAFPASEAITLQGMVIVVGAALGPVAAAEFSTLRTLTRFVNQCVEVVKKSLWPEISMAYGAGDWPLARALHRHACQVSLAISASGLTLLSIFGRRIYHVWTHGTLAFNPLTFYLLLALVVCRSLWSASSIATMAANRHERYAPAMFFSSAISVALAIPAIRLWGLPGVAATLVVSDLAVGWYVIRLSLVFLGESASDFVRALADPKPLCYACLARSPSVHVSGQNERTQP